MAENKGISIKAGKNLESRATENTVSQWVSYLYMPQLTRIQEIMHLVGTQKVLDKWKLVFYFVFSLVSQDTTNTNYEEKLFHNLWKVS